MVEYIADGVSIIELGASANLEVNPKRIHQEVQMQRNSTSTLWMPWGSDNLLPARIIAEVEKDPVIFSSNEFNKSSHFGAGLGYYRKIKTKNGIEKDYSAITEIEDWMEENDINNLFLELITDHETLGNRIASFVLNNGRTKIARMLRKQAAWCRWGKQNAKTKKIDTMYYSSDWSRNDQSMIDIYEVLDAFDPIGHLQYFADRESTGNEFVFRSKVITTNRFYYELANAEVIMNSGNLEMIDLLKTAYKALLNNSLGVAYHIKVTDEYCKKRIKKADEAKWNSEPEFRQKVLKDIKDMVDKWLTGAENKGKSLISVKFRNEKGEQEDGIEITTLDDKLQQNKSIATIQQYHAESYNAMGVDPSNTGIANKNDGMNSGSEKKNAFFNQKATLGVDRMCTLMPFYTVARFNGWTKNYPGFTWEVQDEYMDNNVNNQNTNASKK